MVGAGNKYLDSFMGVKEYVENNLKDKVWDVHLSINANASVDESIIGAVSTRQPKMKLQSCFLMILLESKSVTLSSTTELHRIKVGSSQFPTTTECMILCSTRCYLSRAKMDGTVIWSIPASSMLTLCSWTERTKTARLL